MPKVPKVTYGADITPQPGKVIDGDLRKVAKVTVTRYDKPTDKGKKVGTRIVRAWTKVGLRHEAKQALEDIMRRDQAKRRAEKLDMIERIRGGG